MEMVPAEIGSEVNLVDLSLLAHAALVVKGPLDGIFYNQQLVLMVLVIKTAQPRNLRTLKDPICLSVESLQG
jgi:hypothetical protein